MDLAKTSVDRKRFFITGTGRSGSTLLAAIMADAGADLDMNYRADWNPRSGAYEHQSALRAGIWFQRARKLEEAPLPNFLRIICERRFVHHLKKLLEKVRFVKTSKLIWLTQLTKRIGYSPVMIVSYRSFPGYVRSRYRRNGWSLPFLTETYYEIYSTALLELGIFGGCAIDYEEMTNVAETSWADVLAQVTGLSRDRLLEARAKRLRPNKKPAAPLLFDPEPIDGRPQSVFKSLRNLKGKFVEPGQSGG